MCAIERRSIEVSAMESTTTCAVALKRLRPLFERSFRYLAHAGAGGVSAVAGSGKCGQGAESAVFGKFTTNNINIQNDIGRGVATVVAGGVGSVIGGGKFANGAETAAYGYLFMRC